MTHICVSKLTIIGSDNGLSPDRDQAIIWTYAGILLIRPWGTNFSEILIEIDVFSFKKMHLKMSSVKCRPFCLSLNVLTHWGQNKWRPKQIGCCLRDDIFGEFSWWKMITFLLKFHWSLFLRVHLKISHHWLWLWLGADILVLAWCRNNAAWKTAVISLLKHICNCKSCKYWRRP